MPTVVLDLDLLDLPPELADLGAYDAALILIRMHGRPVGQAWLPVVAGRIDGVTLREALFRAGGWPPWQAWIEAYLAPIMPPELPLPNATIAVCTRNRPADLLPCLAALHRLPDDGQELIVVDNAPSDDSTFAVVQQFPGVRYIREDRPGLSIARNRALREARGEIVAFTDDDTVVDAGWLRALLRTFADPLVLGATGLVLPLELATPAQEWWERYRPFGRGFARRVLTGNTINPIVGGGLAVGASMALRRSVLTTIGPFNERFGAGSGIGAQADNDLYVRILQAGYRFVYEPAALSRHRHRREWAAFLDTLERSGSGVYARWTDQLLRNGEWSVLDIGVRWFFGTQLPRLLKAVLRRPGSLPRDLIMAEVRGSLRGPLAYLNSRRRTERKS